MADSSRVHAIQLPRYQSEHSHSLPLVIPTTHNMKQVTTAFKSIKRASSRATATLDALDSKYQQKLDELDARLQSTPTDFKNLSNDDLAKLAGILTHQPSPTIPKTSSQYTVYARETKADIERLPSHLRASPLPLMKYVDRIIDNTSYDVNDELCHLHAKLNRNQTGSLFRSIKREIDVHIPIIHRDLSSAGLISLEAHEAFLHVREVSAMWLDNETYFSVFQQAPKPRWAFQADGCAACMLARLGGEPDILVPLKAAVIVRAKGDVSTSRRHVYLDSLVINGFIRGQAEDIMQQAMKLGGEVRHQWDRIKSRRKERKATEDLLNTGNIPPNNKRIADRKSPDQEAEDIYDGINDFIDSYRQTVLFDSKPHPPSSPSKMSRPPNSRSQSDSPSPTSVYTASSTALRPRHYPSASTRPIHLRSISDNTAHRGANDFAKSYQNVLGNSGPYQRLDKGKGIGTKTVKVELPKTPKTPRERRHTQISPLSQGKSPAGSESTTWGGFLERVGRAQAEDKGKEKR
ncbi:hypothetical protein EJ08DRAFT_696299 [Tothia fuscella]|uniref:Uncharacterized protein n=1 Tax=Tothia fuscella TaxID=1048955 RepID=A0A9P4NTP2_9PEZI|nr:hypothetical protein EJ08DRAFT_696299 [Tothia fuscella]